MTIGMAREVRLNSTSSPIFDNIGGTHYIRYGDGSIVEVPSNATHFQGPFIKWESVAAARIATADFAAQVETMNPGKIIIPTITFGEGINDGSAAITARVY